jgi:uracil-DNA glycosylase family 4
MKDSVTRLRDDVIACERCPRLRRYCTEVAREKRKAYREEDYWGRPVPDFGASRADLLIVGLAPAAHGGNRTGRMFTGDRSGEWLYRALYRAGFGTQPESVSSNDHLKLLRCAITATAHCAPPDNKPRPDEIRNCSEYLSRSFALHKPRVVLALGGIGWSAVFSHLRGEGRWTAARPKFAHGAEVILSPGVTLLGSYHPSQQNTFTGRLTEPMFDSVFSRARTLVDED